MKKKKIKAQKTLTYLDRDPLVDIAKAILTLNVKIQTFNMSVTDDPNLIRLAENSKDRALDALYKVDSVRHASTINGIIRALDKEWFVVIYFLHAFSDLLASPEIYAKDLATPDN